MEHGRVTSVEYDDGVVYCDVKPVRTRTSYDSVPILKPHLGVVQRPEQGDVVSMEKLSDGTRFISGVISAVDEPPDSVGRGDLVIQLDSETKVAFRKQADGTFDLNLSASGDVTINADNVTIDGIDFDEHRHDYDWTDGAGSGTTDVPK